MTRATHWRTQSARCGLVLVATVAVAAAPQQARKPEPFAWGADVNHGAGEKLIASVHQELVAFIKLSPNARAPRAADLVKRRAVAAIEGWKRFRNPELIELARACLDHPDWHVVHRGLHWLRALGDPTLLERAWPLLVHPERRIREKAAITCLETWDADRGKEIAGGNAKETIAQRVATEPDFFVRQALLALQRRLEGQLELHVLSREVVVPQSDGLLWTPFVPGLKHLSEIAPDATVPDTNEPSPQSALELPVAVKWNAPVLGYGKEEVPNIVMQPFGKPRQKGALFHTGQDMDGCSDGAGLYAIADGVVRWIVSGSDMGVGIVIEHHSAEKELVNAVYMHGGATLFVKAGEHVTAGQILGTMGLSYSIENGGQFAHLHLGLYPGPFKFDHNYGYGAASDGLEGWLDPAKVLPEWIARGVTTEGR